MRLYICIDGSFAGTQAEANAKGKGWSQVEVPTDKAGLIDYLNGMVDEARGELHYHGSSGLDDMPVPVALQPPLAVVPEGARPSLTAVEEFIQSADAAQLARCADNVCWRIKELLPS